jgi:hypothetical protein
VEIKLAGQTPYSTSGLAVTKSHFTLPRTTHFFAGVVFSGGSTTSARVPARRVSNGIVADQF